MDLPIPMIPVHVLGWGMVGGGWGQGGWRVSIMRRNRWWPCLWSVCLQAGRRLKEEGDSLGMRQWSNLPARWTRNISCVRGSPWPLGCPSEGGSSGAGWIDPLANFSVPNRPVRPALGTAGLTQAFSETAGPDYRKPAFQNKSRARPGWPAGLSF